MMIEMAARLSGGDFSESLVPLSTGNNYVRTVIEIAMGVIPDTNELKPKKNKVVANRYFFPPKVILKDIRGVEKARKILQLNKLDLCKIWRYSSRNRFSWKESGGVCSFW